MWEKPLDGTVEEQIATLRWHLERHESDSADAADPKLRAAHRYAAERIGARIVQLEGAMPRRAGSPAYQA